jgi:uncharacterized lipoprotein YmbA
MNQRRAACASVIVAVLLAGCETTEQQSARIAKTLGHQSTGAIDTQITGTNREVRVDQAVLVSSASGTAAALELTNTSATAQADLPILITVSDATGKPVYTNDAVGTSSPSGELSFLPAHATVWWVDGDLLLSGGAPVHIAARIGKAATATPAVPASLSATHLKVGSNFVGPLIGGTVTNGSSTAQTDLAIYAVALSDGHVVAAGQSALPTLGAHTSAPFQVTVVGKPKGATAVVTVAPAHIG